MRLAASTQGSVVVVAGGLLVGPDTVVEHHVENYRVLDPGWVYWKRRMDAEKWAGEEPEKWIPAGRRIQPGHRYAGGWVFPRFANNVRGSRYDQRTYPDGYPLSLVDKVDGKPFELWDHQLQAIQAALDAEAGVIQAACGGGKTTTGIGLISALDTPVLILVHTKPLARQWKNRIEKQLVDFMGDTPEVTMATGANGLKRGRITIAMVQTLANKSFVELSEWSRYFGLVILDEAHHAPARKFSDVLLAMAPKYRIGLTATPTRHDGTTNLLWWHFDRIIHRIEQTELNALDVTRPARIEPIYSAFEPPKLYAVITSTVDESVKDESFHKDNPGTRRALREDEAREYRDSLRRQGTWCKLCIDDSWTSLTMAMAKDDARNKLITDWVKNKVGEGRVVLVLTDRTRHTVILAAKLQALGIRAHAFHGKMPTKDQDALIEKLNRREVDVVISTSLFDEALDVPGLDTGLLAVPTKAMGRIQQRIGRIMRGGDNDKLEPVWGDVVDAPSEFYGMYRTRLGRYIKLGCYAERR